jgi:hypothetical protein
MSGAMNDTQNQAPAQSDGLELSDPSELVSGKPFPMKDYLFRLPDGTKKKVRLQGLSYAVKSAEDRRDAAERAEAEKKGIFQPDLRGPRLLAKAVRTKDGKRPFTREEDEIVYAISLAEQLPDGEINRAYNALMELSGYGKEAMADAEKS